MRSGLGIVLAVSLALAMAGCAGGAEPVERQSVGSTNAPAPEATDGPSTPDGAAATASCDPGAFLPVLEQFNDPDAGLVVDAAEVAGCRNGYARVYAIARENPTGLPQHDNEQVFLRDVAGTWEVVASGTGVSCDDSDLPAELVEVCVGLGERDG